MSFYVAPNGNDNWSGRLPVPGRKKVDGPFATLNRAREAIRQLKVSGRLKAPVSATLRAGTYTLSEPFVLRPEDSGTRECPVSYAAYPGEKAVISGGRKIAGWQRAEGQLWSVELPEAKAGKWYFRQLFVNGQLRRRPRLPREGYAAIAGPATADEWGDPKNRAAFRFKPGDLQKRWANLEDVEVVVLQYWTEARLRIAGLDEQTHTVTFTGSSWRPLTWSRGYYVENVCEALSAPGEWYLDRKTGVLTYWPLPGEELSRAEVVAPVARQLLRLEGEAASGHFVEHLAFRGLTFCHTNAPLPDKGHAYPQAEVPAPDPSSGDTPLHAAISATGARHCRFEGNEIASVGEWGLELSRGCQNNRIVGNRIHDIGAGGIKVGEPVNSEKDVDETCSTVISDNEIREGNKVYFGSPAVWIGQSGRNQVAHNEICGDWQWGVSVGWNWEYLPPNRARDNAIEYNHIHDLGNGILGANGGVYCLGLSPGTVIRRNAIHHIHGGGYGIVLDQGCCGVLVEDNLVHHTDGGLASNFHVIGNIIMNNVFALTTQYEISRYGDDPPGGYQLGNCNICCRNIVYWKEGKLFPRDDWLDFNTVQDLNLYYDARGGPVRFLKYSFEEWKAKGLDRSSIIGDPLFVDPDNGDFTLKPESPAFKLGFRPIDVSEVGPRRRRMEPERS